jgi:hypothetical protein
MTDAQLAPLPDFDKNISIVEVNINIVRAFAENIKTFADVFGSSLALNIITRDYTLNFLFKASWVTKETHEAIQQAVQNNAMVKMLVDSHKLTIDYGQIVQSTKVNEY